MIIFYGITCIVLIALGYVFWLIWKEQPQDDDSLSSSNKEEEVSAADLLDRLGFKKNISQKVGGEKRSLISKLIPSFKKSNPTTLTEQPLKQQLTDDRSQTASGGTAALRLDNEQTQKIDQEVALSIKTDELQKQFDVINEKNQKLESLVTEKNEALEKVQKELDYEQKHRKEFNTIKDVLEKELKETKDASKQIQRDFNSLKTESQTYTSRISQLEDKIKKLEKACIEKDDKIMLLNKKSSDNSQNADEKQDAPKIDVLENEPTDEVLIDEKAKKEILLEKQTQEPSSAKTANSPNATNIADSKISVEEPENTKDGGASDNDAFENVTKEQSKRKPFENPLGLDPVSNLEKRYKDDDGDTSQASAPPTLDKGQIEGEGATQPPDSHPVPTIETKSYDSKTLSDDNQKPKKSNEEDVVDDFLKEHLAQDKKPKIILEEESPLYPTDQKIEPEQEECKSIVSETDSTPSLANLPIKPEKETVDESIGNDHETPPPPEPQSPLIEPDEQSVSKIPAVTATDIPEKSKSEHPTTLAPDIFKDIEEQFRQIEEEMNTTEEDQNIDFEDNSAPEEETDNSSS